MKTINDFLNKADCEGGLAEFILYYGINTNNLKNTELENLISFIDEFKQSYENLKTEIMKYDINEDEFEWLFN